jgi:CheY-like chemotaxis protein
MHEPAVVLVAEDEKTDIYFLEWAFDRAGCPPRLCHVEDGQEAIEYLSGDGLYADRTQFPIPDLFLLDLKMPRLGGFDVLRWLRLHPEWTKLPVVILSSSDYPGDIRLALELGAVEYQVKPSNPQDLVKMACHLDAKWLKSASKTPVIES